MENQNQKSNSNRLWMILLIVSVLLNIFQWTRNNSAITSYQQKVDTLVIEQVNVEKELVDTRNDLEQYRGKSASLDSLLDEANVRLTEQEKQIKDISRNSRNMAEMNAKLKAQLKTLQGLRDEYLTRIDSLLTENQKLQAEKKELTGTVESLNKNLETTVNTASVLRAEYLKVSSYKRKGSGSYSATPTAKRVHKMEVCFDVLENKIAKAGEKTVYLKVTEPGGKPLGNKGMGSGSFKTAAGEDLMYTANSTITYTGVKQNVCLNYEEQQDKMFPVGNYLVEIYIDGNLCGSTTYSLK